ncbi:MAG: glycosyltransferase family 39 protein [Planctomycetota bacterium]|jgi:4-amino-4-deoxy-L-arabinose transferase-like glycosyltransferase
MKKRQKNPTDDRAEQKASEKIGAAAFLDRIPRLWICLFLFFLAFLIRLVYLFELSASPVFEILFVDSERYFEWGRNLAENSFTEDRVFYQEPLYPYFLAAFFKIFGVGHFGPRFLQIILGSLNAVLLFLIGERLFNRRVGLVAGIIASFYRMFVFYDAMFLKTFLSILLFTSVLWVLLWADRKGSGLWRWLAAGLLMGLLVLVRGNYLPVIIVFFIWLSIRVWRRDASERKSRLIKTLGGCAAGFFLVLLPVTIRNAVHGGGFVLTTSQGGQNFYIGNNPENKTGAYQPPRWVLANPMFEEANFREAAKQDLGDNPTPSELSWYWWKKGFAYVAENPGDAFKLQLRKIALFWEDYEVPDNQSVYFMKRYSWLLALLYTPFGILAALASAGMILAWPRRHEISLLYLGLAAYFASIVPFFVVARYRLPAVPLLAVFAAVCIVRVIDILRRRTLEEKVRLKNRAVIIGVLICAFSFFPFYSGERRRQNEFVRYINLGRHYQAENMLPLARKEFEKADRIYPEGPEAPLELGILEYGKVELGQAEAADAAVRHFETALKRARRLHGIGEASSPEYAPARFWRGRTFEELGLLLEAELEYDRAANTEDPVYAPLAGSRLITLQSIIANESNLQEMHNNTPEDPIITVLLAASKLRNGKPAEAERILIELLSRNERIPEAWKVLVKVRLKRANYDGARQAADRLKALGGKPFPDDELSLTVQGSRH